MGGGNQWEVMIGSLSSGVFGAFYAAVGADEGLVAVSRIVLSRAADPPLDSLNFRVICGVFGRCLRHDGTSFIRLGRSRALAIHFTHLRLSVHTQL